MRENQFIEKKKLDIVLGKTANWKELAKDCVCFANSRGGIIYVGIENKEEFPPASQNIDADLPFKIKKNITENTVNVGVNTTIITAENGGQFIKLEILQSASTIASTSDGKYYYRSDDTCVPLLPDELSRLFTDKPSFVWETKRTNISKTNIDQLKTNQFLKDINKSTRVSAHVKQKSLDELLEHYYFSDGDYLTNLGVLWLAKRNDRAKILYCPTIQFFKYDERGQKVNRLLWDDHERNPKELIEAVWSQIPDWKEGIDVADGMFRKFIPNYHEDVLRELIANALVHRPYTMRGDIYINIFPDRLEVANPGLFPIGITPQNVLHKNSRRNEKLAQVFFDLQLMDKEGSGIDKMYEILLSNGKPIPQPIQGDDFVQFTIFKNISKPNVVALLQRASDEFQLTQKEMICLGLIAQYNSLSALEFSLKLNLPTKLNTAVRHWLGRLIDIGLVVSKGKTKGTLYAVNPEFIKNTNFKTQTTLKSITDHRLEELLRKDITDFPNSRFAQISERIGSEINIYKVKRILKAMVENGILEMNGITRNANYSLKQKPVK